MRKIMNQYLGYRGNRDFSKTIEEVAEAVFNASSRKAELKGLEEILSERKACFSTPILLNLGNKRHGGKPPRTASCYIIDIDTMAVEEILALHNNIFKGGGGVGSNLSRHRNIASLLNAMEANAASRHPILPSRGCSIGAVIDHDHPELEGFVKCLHEGKSFRCVIKNVLVSNAFLYSARMPRSEEKGILEMIADSMISTGTPGVLFRDRINQGQPYFIRATNPCAEFHCADDTSAALASINLAAFAKRGIFDFRDFSNVAKTMAIALNAVLDISDYPTSKINENTKKYRPIGVGFTNFLGALKSLGLKYVSDNARGLAGKIASCLERAVRSVGMGNSQTTLIAPTGRISHVMGCESNGIESHGDERQEMFMAAEVQPFLSGGISLTIEYNNPARQQIIDDIYLAHSLGLKSYIAFSK